MASVRPVLRFLARSGKRAAITLLGAALLVAGLVMIVTPGPGAAAIIGGLVVLSTEYVWARRALERARQKGREAVRRVRGGGSPSPE